MRIRLLDTDGSLAAQPGLVAACAQSGGDVIAARDLAPRLRLLASEEALAALDARLGSPVDGDIHFIGSGDFHHLSLLLVKRLKQPVSIIHFDNHPDWIRFPLNLNCGSWVARALERPEVLRVVTLGPASADIEAPQLRGGAVGALRSGRLELHPWFDGATFYAGPSFENAGARGTCGLARDGLRWRGLAEDDWGGRVAGIADRLPEAPVWVSLDKDVLTSAEAVTNWDQGQLRLDAVLEAIDIIAARRPVIGMDVCGDYSPEGSLGTVRSLLARLDRDQRPVPPDAGTAVNEATNLRILSAMEAVLQ
ncbi:hypothetical protein [Ancylobacter defluvii]|uniref:Arginase n=1 Tax=Ancylobacter defluvii TaxID=1282440 RepID=A0A9W6K1K1_9HYPH|nr:hypothetical protein [Ancylobacter defluvii]MBS7586517.1 hypothetical protein [Ancylobacter defluvii]GLK85804.1 hypothetical protein GCM10017653_38740 [Ancylobacter defluvii]